MNDWKEPSVGRIVHVRNFAALHPSEHADVLPAIVTHVFDKGPSGCINVTVFMNGQPPCAHTSLQHEDSAGDGNLQWFWPPRN